MSSQWRSPGLITADCSVFTPAEIARVSSSHPADGPNTSNTSTVTHRSSSTQNWHTFLHITPGKAPQFFTQKLITTLTWCVLVHIRQCIRLNTLNSSIFAESFIFNLKRLFISRPAKQISSTQVPLSKYVGIFIFYFFKSLYLLLFFLLLLFLMLTFAGKGGWGSRLAKPVK